MPPASDERTSPTARAVTHVHQVFGRVEGGVHQKFEWSGHLTDMLDGRAPPRPDKYIPRAGPMKALRRTLLGEREAGGKGRAALWGAAGQGKSVLALAYAEDEAGRYPGGRYRVVVESQTLESALAAMLPALPQFHRMPAPDRARTVSTALSGEPACLLIIDNVDSAAQWSDAAFKALVPSGRCHVIVTTRAENLPGITSIPVERLEEGEAVQLMALHSASAAEGAHAGAVQRVVRAVEGLAVAVASVGAVMALDESDDWAGYAKRLEAVPLDELPDRHGEVRAHTGYSGRISAALDDLYRRLPLPAQRAMDYAALLPQDMVPATDHVHGNPPDARPADWLAMLLAADADPARGAERLDLGTKLTGGSRTPEEFVQRLQKLGLLTPANTERTLWSLHRLHARRCRERLEDRGGRADELLAAIAACAASRQEVIVGRHADGSARRVDDPAVLTDQGLRWELTPLAAVCSVLWETGFPGEAAHVAVWLSPCLQHVGRLSEAAACLSAVTSHYPAVVQTLGNHGIVRCYAHLAAVLQSQGDLAAARNILVQAIAIHTEHSDGDHPAFASLYSNLATIQTLQQDLVAARASLERAIAIDHQYLPEDHPTFGIRYSNLAVIQKNQKDLPAARASVERAIAIEKQNFAEDHPTLATSYHNLASICLADEDREAACTNWRKALAILLKHFDESHPFVRDVRRYMKAVGCAE